MRRARRRTGDLLTYLVFAFCLVFFGLPLLWLISLSVRTTGSLRDRGTW
jgi:ABC-type glycerol-3-phosphate transport system permease component